MPEKAVASLTNFDGSEANFCVGEDEDVKTDASVPSCSRQNLAVTRNGKYAS